ncbi:MAG: hypothetical protein HYZ33_05220, partial [Ignavibacteriales bacterium]|nr:hypothetical protein [Ignavibacteriales bacterium]
MEKVWLATDAGLYCYNKDGFIRFDTKSGLPYNELFCFFPKQNKLYVGTQGKGFAVLDRAIPLSPPPKIMFEETVVEERHALVRWKAYAHWGELSPSEIYTRYRFNNSSWSNWKKRNSVLLDSLQPGEHSVQVQAKGLFGQYDVHSIQTSFTVFPPLHLRPLFYFPVGATTLTIVLLLLSI